jgi:hypothetical protein
MTKIFTSSDVYHQIKPSQLGKLEELLKTQGENSIYQFSFQNWHQGEIGNIWSTRIMKLTNIQIYKLLKKSISIIEHTEEYAEYLLNRVFVEDKSKNYSLPPGTLRFYSEKLICFYNGKTWRKIEP